MFLLSLRCFHYIHYTKYLIHNVFNLQRQAEGLELGGVGVGGWFLLPGYKPDWLVPENSCIYREREREKERERMKVHTYMCVCVCACVRAYMCTCVYVCVVAYVHVYVGMGKCVCACVCSQRMSVRRHAPPTCSWAGFPARSACPCGRWTEPGLAQCCLADLKTQYSQCLSITVHIMDYWSPKYHTHTHIYDLVPKGAHARGYALQLKIKHCWKLFLFEMLCCVLAWMNEYIVQIISATRLWLISRYSHHTLKKCRKMTAKNGHPCTEWFSSLCLQTNRKHMEKQSLICTRKTSFYTDNTTSSLTIVVFSINWSRMFALYVHQMCCTLELKTLNNRKMTALLQNHRKCWVCSDPRICTTQRYSFFSAKFCTKSEEYFSDRLILL